MGQPYTAKEEVSPFQSVYPDEAAIAAEKKAEEVVAPEAEDVQEGA